MPLHYDNVVMVTKGEVLGSRFKIAKGSACVLLQLVYNKYSDYNLLMGSCISESTGNLGSLKTDS